MKSLLFLVLFAACLILANRDTGMFADAENYSEYFNAIVSGYNVNAEPSFIFIANLINSVNLDVRGLFFVYLLLGVFLKGSYFILKMPRHLHIALLYFTNYFIVHDLVQIRIGAALGVALWAVYLLGERKILASLLLWIVAFSLHFSTLLLAIISLLLYIIESNKRKLLIFSWVSLSIISMTTILLLGFFLGGISFNSLFASLFSEISLIPQRYVENYIESEDVIGFSKIIYSFILSTVAFYALNKRMLVSFVARHAAVSLTFASFILVSFKNMPVIGSRLADTLLFFAPLMVFGIYKKNKILGISVYLWMLLVQTVNLFFFSKVIFI